MKIDLDHGVYHKFAGALKLVPEAEREELLPKSTTYEWVTQPPLNEMNPCKICRPMDGQKRKRGELFRSPYNGATALRPPIHISGMCVKVISSIPSK